MHLATQNAVDEKYSSNDLSLFRSPTERNFCGHAEKNFSCDKRMHASAAKNAFHSLLIMMTIIRTHELLLFLARFTVSSGWLGSRVVSVQCGLGSNRSDQSAPV